MIPVSDKVVENAKQCLEILNDDFELDMFLFNNSNCVPVEEKNVCNTKFCIAGWQAHKEGYPEAYLIRDDCFKYIYFSFDKVDDDRIAWSFFYSSSWSNDREYAKERMRFVIENKAIPDFINDDAGFEGFPWRKEI